MSNWEMFNCSNCDSSKKLVDTVRLGYVRLGYVRLGKVRLGKVRLG